MSYSRCPYLLSEYIGQFNAAICKCKEDKNCYKTYTSIREVSSECFNVHARRKRPTGFTSFGDGEPMVQPDTPAALATPVTPAASVTPVTPVAPAEQFPESP